MNHEPRHTPLCPRCREYWPCSDTCRRDISPEERATHLPRVLTTEAYHRDAGALSWRKWQHP